MKSITQKPLSENRVELPGEISQNERYHEYQIAQSMTSVRTRLHGETYPLTATLEALLFLNNEQALEDKASIPTQIIFRAVKNALLNNA
jgi:hypothetical protein